MKLIVVGSSGSCASPSSAASCYLVQCHDANRRLWNLVLDLGSGSFGPLQQLVAPEALDAVAITHLHPDHCADLTGLQVYAKLRPGAQMDGLPVYGPSGTSKQLAAMQYSAGDRASVFAIGTWRTGQAVQVGPLLIRPFAVDHPVETWGLRITGPSAVDGKPRTLAYSGDTDLCPGLEALADGADLLLAEAAFLEGRDTASRMHLTGWRAGQVASRAGVKRLVVTHVPPWYDGAQTVAEAAGAYSGPVHLARPNHTFLV